jgi:Mg2+ and Co2+ transporter CorA
VLIEYYSDEQLRPEATDGSVLHLVYYPLRVAIGEWMIYNQVMARYLSYYEYSLRSINTIVNGEKGDLIDLQKWRHRAIQSRAKIESTKIFVHYWLDQQNNRSNIWNLILTDLDSLSKQIEQYGQSLERIIPIVTSMVQLYDARRSVTESINVRRLTYVALIFVPLSWVATLFSMADDYGPGKPRFWVYFAVSLPFCLLVFACSFLASSPATNLLNRIGAQLRS